MLLLATKEASTEPLTIWDVIAMVVVALPALGLVTAGGTLSPSFDGMFKDFGVVLPAVTRLVIQPWGPALVALPAIAFLIAAGVVRSLLARRVLIGASFAAIALGWLFYFYALYLPIYQTADAIR